MKLWAALTDALDWRETTMRHEFVIGPLCDSTFFGRKARLYYWNRYRWSFLVCESKVAVLDEGGDPSGGDESSRRFSIFDENPCPVLEAFASESLAEDSTTSRAFPGKQLYASRKHFFSTSHVLRPSVSVHACEGTHGGTVDLPSSDGARYLQNSSRD
jgi:hypothetical protein